jgi:hypothetical protein
MKIHLIPDDSIDDALYTQVVELLQAVPGVNKFYVNGVGRFKLPPELQEEQEVPDRASFEKKDVIKTKLSISNESPQSSARRTWSFPNIRLAVRWSDLFTQIQEYRSIYGIPEGEFVILLTPVANKKNWFALLDEKHPFNGFIHTDEWEHFISCNPAFPIAFEVVALALQKHIFKKFSDVEKLTHDKPIGCVSDLCMRKTDIILKMRTADVCPDCMQRIQKELSMPEIHHALSILESLRVKMLYAQNFRQSSPPSRMEIKRGGRIFLTDYEHVEIKMPSMEKALYLLFLRHPEGIYLSALADHRKELYEIYAQISTRGMREDMERRIDEMTNTLLKDQLSVKISRIKKAFTDVIGSSLGDHYIIQGEHAEKKGIRLDRSLVS